jgi:transketolase
LGNPGGRYFRFGVREHGMAAICNGLAAYGGLIPFGATFFNFLGYAQGAFRLSALSQLRVLYIMTHDSIGLGEDGPTHQPIEMLALCRSTPNSLTMRPADGNEVSGCYLAAFENAKRPSVLCLTRQNLPQLEGSSIEKTLKGGYLLQDFGTPQVILVGTGSEVSLCVEAAKLLSQSDVGARVVSLPCWELFDEQSSEYKQSVLLVNGKAVPVLSVEVMSSYGWGNFAHASVAINTFGASGPYTVSFVLDVGILSLE